MSDQRIRDLERAYRESGDPRDGGRLLRAREQAQELPQGAVQALAYLGDPGARQLLDAPPAQEPIGLTALAAWLEGLGQLGPSVLPRAQCALLGWAHDVAWAEGFPERNVLQRGFLNACSTWIEDLRGWVQRGCAGPDPQLAVPKDGLIVFCSYRNARGELAHHLLRVGSGSVSPGWESRVGDYAGDPSRVTLPDVRTQATVVAEAVAAVRQALTPWLSALGDPLQDAPSAPSVSLASSCPTTWGSMMPGSTPCARVCHDCGATVFGMEDMPLEEARALLEVDGPCFRVYRREDGKIMTGDCLPGLRSLADPYAGIEANPGPAPTVFTNPAPAPPHDWTGLESDVNPGPAVFANPAPDFPQLPADPWTEEWFPESTVDPFPDVDLPDPFGRSLHDPFDEGVDPFAPPSRDPFTVDPHGSPDLDDPYRVAFGPAHEVDRQPEEPFDPLTDLDQ